MVSLPSNYKLSSMFCSPMTRNYFKSIRKLAPDLQFTQESPKPYNSKASNVKL